MDIIFKTKRLEKELNSSKRLIKKYGSKTTRFIMRRMKVLAAANSLADVPHQPPERCHQLSGGRDEQFAVVIRDQWRLIFVPNHETIPRKRAGGIELSQITAIEIIWIGDYHE